jgi:hypothetical protein
MLKIRIKLVVFMENWIIHVGEYKAPSGRWPANFVHDGSPEVVAGFPETGPSKAAPRGSVQRYDPSDLDAKRPKGGNGVRGVDDAGGSAARFFKSCVYQEEELCQDLSPTPLNANIAESVLYHQGRLVDFVLSLVAIEGNQEDKLLSGVVELFMNEIRRQLKSKDGSNIKEIQSIGIKCLHDLRHMITEKLNNNPVRSAEILMLTNTMTIIASLLNTDGFVEVVISDTRLRNMVLGGKDSPLRIKYCAKASRTDRNEGLEDTTNSHPTVKPTNLMRWLVRLVTPPDGIVLDPFMGSGSTGKAVMIEGFDFIGMEMDEKYLEIAEKRIIDARENRDGILEEDKKDENKV